MRSLLSRLYSNCESQGPEVSDPWGHILMFRGHRLKAFPLLVLCMVGSRRLRLPPPRPGVTCHSCCKGPEDREIGAGPWAHACHCPNTCTSCLSQAGCQDFKPDVISQLEQGGSPWMVWRDIPRDPSPGEEMGRRPGGSCRRLSRKPVVSGSIGEIPGEIRAASRIIPAQKLLFSPA